MAFSKPRFPKSIERHPANKEPDVSQAMREAIVAGLQEHGIVGNKVVYLADGQCIDGWQFLQSCIIAGVEPDFAPMPKGIEPEAFVEIMNLRRHQIEEDVVRKAKERRERVAKARAEGQSLRTIAEAEKVSEATVRIDLEKVTAQGGCAVTPPDGKITGKDGRQQPASKPILEEKPASEEKKSKPGKPRFDESKFEKAYGQLIRVVDERGNAMGKNKHYQRCVTLLGDLLDEYKQWKR